MLSKYSLLIIFRDGMLWPDGYGGRGVYPGYSPDTHHTTLSDPPIIHHDVSPKMWMTTAQGRAVKAFVESGHAALFFHNSSHISLSNDDFRDVEGAIYTGHPPTRPYKIHIVNSNHPITKGVHDFIVTDEQHYVQYEKDPAHVLLKSENLNGLSYSGTMGNQGPLCEAGWAYDYGLGRVVFFAPGHTIPALWNSEYVKLQQNAVAWLLRKE
jgi:type 1 glutamine amidotransferase